MTQVSPISTNFSINTNLGKRASLKNIEPEIKSLVNQLLTANPKITEDEVRVVVESYLDELAHNTKIGSAKSKAGGIVHELMETHHKKSTIATPVSKPQTVMRTTEIPTESLIANSPLVRPEITPSGTGVSKKELKRAERLDRQLGGGLSEIVPQGISEQEQWEAQMAEKQVTEPPKSNNQNKKIANAEYMSSKKKKSAKKQAIEKSRIEHKNRRIKNSRTGRNLSYCTSHGIISSEAKGAKEAMRLVEKSQGIFSKEAMAVYPDNKVAVKNAQDSFRVFEEAGLIPEKTESKPPVKQPKKHHRQSGGGDYYYSSSGTRNTAVHTTTPSVSTKPAANTVKKEVVTEIKEVVKEVPKTNKWLVAGAFIAGGLATWLGFEIFGNKQKKIS